MVEASELNISDLKAIFKLHDQPKSYDGAKCRVGKGMDFANNHVYLKLSLDILLIILGKLSEKMCSLNKESFYHIPIKLIKI